MICHYCKANRLSARVVVERTNLGGHILYNLPFCDWSCLYNWMTKNGGLKKVLREHAEMMNVIVDAYKVLPGEMK